MPAYEAIAEFGSKILDKIASSETGGKILDLAGTKRMEFSRSPEAQAISKMLGEFRYENDSTLTHLATPHTELMKGIENDADLRNKFNLKTTPLSDIHNHLTKTNHPLAGASSVVAAQDPKYLSQTLEEIRLHNVGKAKTEAITKVFGSKMQNLQPHIMPLLEHPDPIVNMHGQRVLDYLSNELRDTTQGRTLQGGVLDVSDVKNKIANTVAVKNKARELQGLKPLRVPNVTPTYKPTSSQEKAIARWTYLVQTPFVAIQHIGSIFNLGDAPMRALAKTLFEAAPEERDALVKASGALASTESEIMHRFVEAHTGIIAESPLLGPNVGKLVQECIHAPGFNYVRHSQISLTAAVGYHSVIEWAEQAVKGNKRAIIELEDMGLDSKSIIQRKGQLTEAELKKGIYKFTSDRMLINRGLSQSFKANSSTLMRSATMYHSFMNAQVSLIRSTLHKMLLARDYMGLIQYVGTIGVLFPAIAAPLLKTASTLLRTGSPIQAKDSLIESYSALSGAEGFGKFSDEYLDLVSHIGGLGIYINYLKASQNHRLQSAVLGPLLSTPITFADDLLQSAKANKSGYHNFNPVTRDILQDLVPLAGKPLSHILAPTTKEKPVAHTRRGRRR